MSSGSKLQRLRQLLKNLPSELPVHRGNEKSKFPLPYDGDLAAEEGPWTALNSALHKTFGYRGSSDGLKITERGDDVVAVVDVFEFVIKEDAGKSSVLIDEWLDSLIETALSAGAGESRAAAVRLFGLDLCHCLNTLSPSARHQGQRRCAHWRFSTKGPGKATAVGSK